MGKIIKKLIVALIAFAIFAFTIYAESGIEVEVASSLQKDVTVSTNQAGANLVREGSTNSFTVDQIFNVGDVLQTGNGQIAAVNFDDYGKIRLAPLTSVEFLAKTESGYSFELQQGQVFYNGKYANSLINIKALGSVLIPRRAIFNMSQVDGNVKLHSFAGQVNVGLVDENYSQGEPVAFPNGEYINNFMITEGTQVNISSSKVFENSEILSQLLYSKLIKEFSYALFDRAQLIENAWISQNLDLDTDLKDQVKNDKEEKIQRRNLNYSNLDSLGYELNRLVASLSDVFTVTKFKRAERNVQDIVDHLQDAQYLLIFNREDEAKQRLSLVKTLINEGKAGNSEVFLNRLNERLMFMYEDLLYAVPGEATSDVRKFLGDYLIDNLPIDEAYLLDKLLITRDPVNAAYALAGRNQINARISLEEYNQRFTKFFNREKALLNNKTYLLGEENQIVESLLKQYSSFYESVFFEFKRFLEEKWLALIPDGPDKIEEQQTMISTKIDLLKRLRTFFLAGDVELSEARLIAQHLIEEIRDLLPEGDTGVTSLFNQRLEDYGDFLRFLNSTDVSSIKSVGAQSLYEQFQESSDVQTQINDVISDFLGEEVSADEPEISLDEIEELVIEDFKSIQAQNVRLGVGAVIEGDMVMGVLGEINENEFTLDYDLGKEWVSNVIVDGEVVISKSARLTSLPILLPEKAIDVEPEDEPAQPEQPAEKQLTQAEKVALILVARKLSQNDVSADTKNIDVIDIDAGIFVVNSAKLADDENVVFSFAYDNKKNEVTQLIVASESNGNVKVSNAISLEDLTQEVLNVY
ncbi:hypothetical protein GF340_05520 [Candidatus Peregrinibacteria bacterium]|nr:hypothetical protein [Candidatus Peregrinibacteria bacterium]